MFFELTNSPASFQTMMNAILKDLIDQGHVVVYMDDILVFTKDLEEHRRIVNEVLRQLKENDLFLKPQKCFFEQKEVKFLGLIISDPHGFCNPCGSRVRVTPDTGMGHKFRIHNYTCTRARVHGY